METRKGAIELAPELKRHIEYSALAESHIRILTLKANPLSDAKVECTLKSANLGSLIEPYIALSYVWGNQSTSREIIVDGQIFSATENLEAALRHIRDAQEDIQLWVDAICINQNDSHEIDQQLPLMRDIFSHASQTLVWLGPEADESDKAMDLITRILDKLEQSALSDEDENAKYEFSTRTDHGNAKPWSDEAYLIALHHLFARPYFFRVWVVQEIAMSSKVVVCCGQSRLSWVSLARAAGFIARSMEIEPVVLKRLESQPSFQIRTYKSLHRGVQRICSIHSVRADVLASERSEERPPDSLLYLLSSHRITEATKPNDKYLALAGLVREDPSIKSQKSCTSSVADTYMLAAESVAKQYKNEGALDFLDFAGWPVNPVYEKDLPSWTPDWSYTQGRAIPLLYWQLAGEKHKDFVNLNAPGRATACPPDAYSFRRGEKCLVARGFVVDAINGVGFSRWPHGEDRTVQNPTKSAVKSQQYPIDAEPLADVIWKTFVMNIADMDGLKAPAEWGDLFYQKLFRPDHSSHRSHELWYKQNKDFQIFGTTLEEIAKQQREMRQNILSDDAFTADKTMQTTLEQLMAAFNTAVTYRRLATTDNGYLCLAPSTTRPGDIIMIFLSCHVPVVLRREDGESHFKFVGTCYVHGIMQGEALEWLSNQSTDEFVIR